MKKLKYDAVSYVFKNGNTKHKLALILTLGSSKEDKKKLVEELNLMQNSDGGWSWQLKRGNPSGVSQTAITLELLLKAGIDKNSMVVKRAVSFLLQRQKFEGGWSENSELEGIIPKESDYLSKYGGFQTAYVMNAVIEADAWATLQ